MSLLQRLQRLRSGPDVNTEETSFACVALGVTALLDNGAVIAEYQHMDAGDPSANGPNFLTIAPPHEGRGAWPRALLLLAAGAVIALSVMIVLAYQRPDLLLEAINVRYCG